MDARSVAAPPSAPPPGGPRPGHTRSARRRRATERAHRACPPTHGAAALFRRRTLDGTDVACLARMRIRFDRGTLVIEAQHADEDPSQIPRAAWDAELRGW